MEVNEQVRIAGSALFSVDPESFRSLEGTDGAVYLCRRGELAHVIKFIPSTDENIPVFEEKLAFILYLADHGVNLASPLPSQNDRRYEQIEVDGEKFLVVLMPFAPGKQVNYIRTPNEWNEYLFFSWGQVIGKMHALTQQYPYWQRTGADGTQISGIDDWETEHQFFANWSQEPKIVEKWLPLKDQLQQLPRTRDSFGLIHNDLHHNNFLYDPKAPAGKEITIIDFDVCAYHWFITDIAIALYHAMEETMGGRKAKDPSAVAMNFLQPFLRGYQQENKLDPFWLSQLNTFLKYRQILLYIALSNSWPEERRNPWQENFLKSTRRAILTDKPVLPKEFIRLFE